MPGQIVNISNNQAISEVALKCGDPFFRDFPKNIYSQAVYRAEREIAKEYGTLKFTPWKDDQGRLYREPIDPTQTTFANFTRVGFVPSVH